MSFEAFDPSWFGEDAEQVTLLEAQREAEARALEHAKDILAKRLLTVTADHNGKYLRPAKWEYLRDFLESL